MPIYRFYRLRWLDEWYRLSEEEKETLLSRVGEARDEVSGHRIVECQSGWANETWHVFGIEEYPSVEALQEHRRLLERVNWFQYVESESMVGTSLENQTGTWSNTW